MKLKQNSLKQSWNSFVSCFIWVCGQFSLCYFLNICIRLIRCWILCAVFWYGSVLSDTNELHSCFSPHRALLFRCFFGKWLFYEMWFSLSLQTPQISFLVALLVAIVVANSAILISIVTSSAGRKSRMKFFIMHLAIAGKHRLEYTGWSEKECLMAIDQQTVLKQTKLWTFCSLPITAG